MQVDAWHPEERSIADSNAALARVALRQHGVFSRAQILESGFTRAQLTHRVRIGEWERVFPSVYKLCGDPLTWKAQMCAALLWAGSAATISHRAAGRIWSLPGCEEAGPELTLQRHIRCPTGVVVHRSCLDHHETNRKGPFVLTSVARTLFDVSAVLSRNQVEAALDHALMRGLVTIPRLMAQMERSAGRGKPGAQAFRELMIARDPDRKPSESELERRFLKLLREAGLPLPVTQLEVRVGDRVVARIDFAYPDMMIAIETDGYLWHGGHSAWRRDAERSNRLVELGWRVVRITWKDVTEDPEKVVRRIRRLLAHGDPNLVAPGSISEPGAPRFGGRQG